MNRALLQLLVSILLTLTASACITEVDVGNCDNTVALFRYYADGSDDVFPQYISTVCCMVYDKEGNLVSETNLSSNDLADFQGIRLQLSEPGDYRMVCWGNIGIETSLVQSDNTPFHIAANKAHYTGGTPRTHDSMYLGTLDFTVAHAGDIQENLEVIFHCAHISLKATIEADRDAASRADDSYALEVEGLPAAVAHTGEGAGNLISYSPDFAPDAATGNLVAECELPRFSETTGATVHVHNTTLGEKIASVSLAKYIADNSIVISGREEIDIEMLIRLNGTQVSITFPGWKHDQVTPKF